MRNLIIIVGILVLNINAIDVLLAIGDTPLVDLGVQFLGVGGVLGSGGAVLVDVVDLLDLELVHPEALRHLLRSHRLYGVPTHQHLP